MKAFLVLMLDICDMSKKYNFFLFPGRFETMDQDETSTTKDVGSHLNAKGSRMLNRLQIRKPQQLETLTLLIEYQLW